MCRKWGGRLNRMKLYLVQEKTCTCGYNGGTDYIFNLKGIFKSKERAMRAKRGFDMVVTEIDSDLFDSGKL